MQIYTDWANHYLEKAKNKHTISDLQQDVSDGVLLAEVIEAVSKCQWGSANRWILVSKAQSIRYNLFSMVQPIKCNLLSRAKLIRYNLVSRVQPIRYN